MNPLILAIKNHVRHLGENALALEALLADNSDGLDLRRHPRINSNSTIPTRVA
jgi:hypothetical protein